MTSLTSSITSHGIGEALWHAMGTARAALGRRRISASTARRSRTPDLRDLPDHLLRDIGLAREPRRRPPPYSYL